MDDALRTVVGVGGQSLRGRRLRTVRPVRRVGPVGLLLLALTSVATAEPPDRLAQIQALADAGRHARAMEEAEAMLDSLPPDERPVAWKLDFNGHTVENAFIGRDLVYLFSRVSRRSTRAANRPDLSPALGHVFARAGHYDAVLAVTCVDGRTGERLWTRHEYPNSRYALDPEDDALWIWGRVGESKIQRIDPETGDVVFACDLPKPPRGSLWLRGIRRRGVSVWAQATRNDGNGHTGVEYDLDEKTFRTAVPHPGTVSRNRLRVLRASLKQSPDNVSVAVQLLPHGPYQGDPLWAYESLGYSGNYPVWLGRDVLFLSGHNELSHGILYRLDGATGLPRWGRPLPEMAYCPGRAQLANGSYAPGGWGAVGEVAGYVTALGARGTVFFLDPGSGRIERRLPTGMPFLCFPRVVGDLLVMAGFRALWAVPLEHALHGSNTIPVQVWTLMARSCLARGDLEQAEHTARHACEQYPGDPGPWRVLGEIHRLSGREDRAVTAEVRAMDLAGETVSSSMRDSHGLLWRCPTAPVSASLVKAGPLLLVGAQDGSLLTLDPLGSRVLDREHVWTDIFSLYLKGDALYRSGYDRRDVLIRRFAGRGPELDESDPLHRTVEPKGLPRRWYTVSGYDGPPVQLGRRWVRPLRGGRVRIAEDGEVWEMAPEVQGIEKWRIAVTDREPLGYGTGGVYLLDDNTRPVKKLIDAGKRERDGRALSIRAVAAQGDTIAVLGGHGRALLQLFSRDGRELRPAIPVPISRDHFRSGTCLRLVRDGILFSGEQLLWVPLDPARPAWRFDAGHGFGYPRLFGDHLVVANRHGGVYVFDVNAITAGKE